MWVDFFVVNFPSSFLFWGLLLSSFVLFLDGMIMFYVNIRVCGIFL